MKPDPVRLSNTREWLLRGLEDLANAQHDLGADPPFVKSALFHCQQAVEKAMKALLVWHDTPFRRTHNLEELGALCAAAEPTLAASVAQATPLTEYASRFRYPGAPYEPGAEEAREAIALANTFVEAVRAVLPREIGTS